MSEAISQSLLACHSAAQAALLRRLGSVELAEDAMQDAVVKALETWPQQGVPANPGAWLVSTGLNAFRDQFRRQRRGRELMQQYPDLQSLLDEHHDDDTSIEFFHDDVLRLIFLTCHPALAPENQLALTLKLVMGFSIEEIARALLVPAATLERRIARAKQKIRDSGISFDLPTLALLDARLQSVQQVLYLVFNEGYHSGGKILIDRELCRQAIQLARALCRSYPVPENLGLLALMLFDDARAPARLDSNSNIVTLDRQDRHLWKHGQIREADVLLQKALRRKQTGSYQMQAAISGVHCLTPTATATDWHEIVGLYRHLLKFDCSPVVQLNYAVALMMSGDHDTPGTILERLRDALQNYSPYFAAWGRLCELRGDMQAAGAALDQAAALSASEQERRFHLSRAASMLAS